MEFVKKLKNGIEPVDRWMKKFIYTDFYMWLILAIVFIGWVTKCAPFGFIALILVSSIVLLFADDILPLLVNIFSAVLMIYTDVLEEFLYLWPVFIPLGISIGVFVVRNVKIKIQTPGKKFTLGKMFFPQLAVSVALLLGGAGVISGENYVTALPNSLFLGFGALAVYLLVRNFIKTEGDFDRTIYFAKLMAYIGVVVGIQLIIVIAKSGVPASLWHTSQAYWSVGWGNRNNIATYLIFSGPMCMYLFAKHRCGLIYFLMAVFQYICLFMTFSRGGILFGFIAFAIGLIFVVYKSKDRKRQLWYVCATVLLTAIIFVIMRDTVSDAIGSLLDRGTGLSGRDILYDEAWALFKAHPFQGVGMGYVGDGPGQFNVMALYWFHSTLFQVLACMGIIGAAAYLFSYVVKGILLCKNLRNTFNLFVIVVFIGFEGYSMMDTGTFVPFPNAMLVLVLMCLVEMFTSDAVTAKYDKLCKTEIYTRETTKSKSADACATK